MLADAIPRLFAVFVILAAGAAVFYAIVREPSRYYRLERVAYCYPLGLAVLGMPMFLMSWAGFHLAVLPILVLVGFGAALAFWIRRVPLRDFWVPHKDASVPRERLSEFEWFLVAIILVCLGARTLACLLAPLNDWDGLCVWGLKAKILYYDTVRTTDYFQNQQYAFSMGVYPLLWPLMYTWVCTVLGSWDDLGMLILNPINFIVFIVLLYCMLRRFAARTVALAITAVMASLPTLLHYVECGQGDVPMMLISGASLFCLFDWMQHRRTDSILLAAVLMGGALFTKTEGVIIFGAHLCAALLSIFVGTQPTERKRLLGQFAVYFAIAAVMAAPWFVFRPSITLTDWAHAGTGLSTVRWGKIPTMIGIIFDNAVRFQNQVRLAKWHILWPLFAFATVVTYRQVGRPPWICLLVAFVLHASAVALVFLASRSPLTLQELEIGFERYTLIMLPPVWLLLGYEVNYFWGIWRSTRASKPVPTARTDGVAR
jgi:hypothetical protein